MYALSVHVFPKAGQFLYLSLLPHLLHSFFVSMLWSDLPSHFFGFTAFTLCTSVSLFNAFISWWFHWPCKCQWLFWERDLPLSAVWLLTDCSLCHMQFCHKLMSRAVPWTHSLLLYFSGLWHKLQTFLRVPASAWRTRLMYGDFLRCSQKSLNLSFSTCILYFFSSVKCNVLQTLIASSPATSRNIAHCTFLDFSPIPLAVMKSSNLWIQLFQFSEMAVIVPW